jgi:hypothetical protein
MGGRGSLVKSMPSAFSVPSIRTGPDARVEYADAGSLEFVVQRLAERGDVGLGAALSAVYGTGANATADATPAQSRLVPGGLAADAAWRACRTGAARSAALLARQGARLTVSITGISV